MPNRKALFLTRPMIPAITAFKESPDEGKGQARDMRVRWALEEVNQPYDVRLVLFREMKEPAHLAVHPFGQIPTYEEGGLALFESGAIVFHIAQRQAGLLPDDLLARACAITWMFAALNTVEPPWSNLRPRPSSSRTSLVISSACHCSKNAPAHGWTACHGALVPGNGSTAPSPRAIS